jgi:thiamine-phosphate pyrophosphorylase
MIDYSLYLVTDSDFCCGGFFDTIEKAIAGGVSIIQIREKSLGSRPFLEKASRLMQIAKSAGVPVLINDRVDIALAVGADGVHIGQNDLPLEIVRRIIGQGAVIGVSVSSVEEAHLAENGGADYIAVSPVWGTPTKPDTPEAVGLGGTAKIARSVSIPCVGIGGINANNAADVIKTGCAGVAVVSAIMASEFPEKSAKELRRIIDAAKKD